jgi:hypothetical protein
MTQKILKAKLIYAISPEELEEKINIFLISFTNIQVISIALNNEEKSTSKSNLNAPKEFKNLNRSSNTQQKIIFCMIYRGETKSDSFDDSAFRMEEDILNSIEKRNKKFLNENIPNFSDGLH